MNPDPIDATVKLKTPDIPESSVPLQGRIRRRNERVRPGRQWVHRLSPVLGVSLFLLVLWVLHHQLEQHHYRDIVREVQTIPPQRLGWALLLTAFSYLILTGHDALAFRYLHYP